MEATKGQENGAMWAMEELEGKRAEQRLSRWVQAWLRRRRRKWNDTEQCKENKLLMSCTKNENPLTCATCSIKPLNSNVNREEKSCMEL